MDAALDMAALDVRERPTTATSNARSRATSRRAKPRWQRSPPPAFAQALTNRTCERMLILRRVLRKCPCAFTRRRLSPESIFPHVDVVVVAGGKFREGLP